MRGQDALDACAEGAGIGRVDDDLAHYFRKYSSGLAAAGEPRLEGDGGTGEDGGGGAALDALRRGGSDPAPVHAPSRARGRDREGRAARAQPLRRAPGAVLPAADRAARRPRRAADGDGRATWTDMRGCAPTRARWTRRRGRATRWGGCSRPPSRIPACSTCCAASSRCSTSRPAARGSAWDGAGALAFRLKLLLAAGLAPQLAACASCGEREHLVGFSGAAGGVVCGACEAGSFPLGEEAYGFMTDALARPLSEAPGGAGARARAGGAGDRGDARASRARAPDAGGRALSIAGEAAPPC